MNVTRVLKLPHGRMEVDDLNRVQRVILADGTHAMGEPHMDPARYSPAQIISYAERARQDGTPDVWQACVEHDWAHQFLAGCFGWESSLSLWTAAHPELRLPRGIIPFEDTVVRAFVRFCHGGPPEPVLGLLMAWGRDIHELRRIALAELGRA